MIVAVSALSGQEYGSRTYFNNLLPALARNDSSTIYHVYVTRGSTLRDSVPAGKIVFHEVDAWGALGRFLWEQLIMPIEAARIKADIIFNAKNITVLLSPLKRVVAVRNMEPFFFNQYGNNLLHDARSRLRMFFTRVSCRRAAAVIAVSDFARDSIMRNIPGTGGKIVTVYNGNPVSACVRADTGQKKPFLLSASKFVPYANQLNLVEAYALLRKRRALPALIMAGGIHDRAYHRKVVDRVARLGLQDSVLFPGLIERSRFYGLLAACEAFVFPSTLEACPQTLIEAMACLAPIACSASDPMPEICGRAAVYFTPDDPVDIARKIEMVLEQPVKEELKNQCAAQARKFSWELSAQRIARLLADVNAGRPVR